MLWIFCTTVCTNKLKAYNKSAASWHDNVLYNVFEVGGVA